jgi:hypothetical protein
MNQAIKLAKEYGWEGVTFWNCETSKDYEHAIIDPLFWQALGKALGQDDMVVCTIKPPLNRFIRQLQRLGFTYDRIEGWKDVEELMEITETWWKHHAHQYLDLVLTGGDTEKFWKELLSPLDGR